MTRVDPLDVIERAYDLESPDRAWLEGLLERTAPAVDAGHGVLAYLYDAAARPLRAWGFVGKCEPSRRDILDILAAADDEYVADSFLVTPFATASERPGFDRQRTFHQRLGRYGIADAMALNAFDASGLGAWIGGFLPARQKVEAAERERWAKVSMHVAAALRLRQRLRARKLAREKEAEAILTTSGRIEDAESEILSARKALGEAVVRLERARGRLRRSEPDEALDSWRVLVRARWSLVDHFESDGRRFVLAFRNVPASRGPESFTERESEIVALAALGHSAKFIAYDLGLAPATVRVHLTNASRKLGVRTRAALVARYRAWLFQQSPS